MILLLPPEILLLPPEIFFLPVEIFFLPVEIFFLPMETLVSAVRIKIITGHKFESDSNVFIFARKNKSAAVNTLVTAVNTLVTAFCTQNKISGTVFGVLAA